ncbi:MAG: hypothetical protein HZA52_03050 [Planctomycetes bacterium]|nr:hypothetical protein [Planctomycetota bacterium]
MDGDAEVDGIELPEEKVRIESPAQFTAIIQLIKRALEAGTLRLERPTIPSYTVRDFSTVEDDGPWDDSVVAYFVGPGGERYELQVETYRGSGGWFGPSE